MKAFNCRQSTPKIIYFSHLHIAPVKFLYNMSIVITHRTQRLQEPFSQFNSFLYEILLSISRVHNFGEEIDDSKTKQSVLDVISSRDRLHSVRRTAASSMDFNEGSRVSRALRRRYTWDRCDYDGIMSGFIPLWTKFRN